MASRAEQKAAARAAREAKQQELRLAAARRQRWYVTGGIVGAAVIALIVVIVASSGGHKGTNGVKLTHKEKQSAIATVNQTLSGIPQSGNVLGKASAPVTITEYGDLVCPICKEFALTTEPQIITALVRTGKAKLVYKAFDTASSYANESMFTTSQAAAKAAGLQGKEWNYVLLTYEEQPDTIDGTDAEKVSYVTTGYLQNLAQQIKGLNTIKWQSDLASKTLANQVNADESSGQTLGVGKIGTPDVFVTGPNGTQNPQGIPSLAGMDSAVQQVS
jgi:protein-disulfide isomerase